MSIYDDIYRRTNEAQQKAREQENIRSQSRARGDWQMANDALYNMSGINGLPSSYWVHVRQRAREKGDNELSNLARDKANEASQESSGPIPPFPGSGWGFRV